MTTKPLPYKRPDETTGVYFRPKAWLKHYGVSVRAASRAAEISDTSIHLWDQAGIVPLSFWKLCWMQFAPQQRPTSPQLATVELPFKVTSLMLESAAAFDATYRGIVPTVKESVPEAAAATGVGLPPRTVKARRPRKKGRHTQAATPAPTQRPTPAQRPAPKLAAPLVPTPEPAPTPYVRVETPTSPGLATTHEVEVLLALLVQVTAQRDQLTHRVYLLETQRRTEDQLRARIAELERELTAFKELADAATAPTASTVLPAKVEPRAAERVEQLLKQRAPSLVEELKNLPRAAVVS